MSEQGLASGSRESAAHPLLHHFQGVWPQAHHLIRRAQGGVATDSPTLSEFQFLYPHSGGNKVPA